MPSRPFADHRQEPPWALVSELIAETIGLHFPRERWPELQRGLTGAAAEFGFEDVAACAEWLLSGTVTTSQRQVLASHLTIGETYFFRDKQAFGVLATHVLPELIGARRGRTQRLRLWSAACCSGEEAYSLAILLHQILPDLADWHVTILGTDINPIFLRKAVAGSYGDWSFRDVPAGFKERYFDRGADGRYIIRPAIRKLVRFEHVNLVEDAYPSLATDTNAMDLILCRNVLMYFTPAQTSRVIGKLHHALMDGGWLAVSPSEASQALFRQFVTRNFPGVILYQKSEDRANGRPAMAPQVPGGVRDVGVPAPGLPPPPRAAAVQPPASAPVPPRGTPARAGTAPTPYTAAVSLYDQGRYAEAADTLLAICAARMPEPRALSLLARALANQGRLADALVWCDRWVAADKMDPGGHYLRAMVLMEHGDQDDARRSLQRALYLDPDFVLAHFALGIVARSRNRSDEANKHFTSALHRLHRLQTHDVLPESDGLTVGRLTDTIAAMTPAERTE